MIGFVTRPQAPPSAETLQLVDGVIAGAPLIKLTTPAPWLQVSRLFDQRFELISRSRAGLSPPTSVWGRS